MDQLCLQLMRNKKVGTYIDLGSFVLVVGKLLLCFEFGQDSSFQPLQYIGKHEVQVFRQLAVGQGMPHVGIQFEGLVDGASRFVQEFAHRRICHLIIPSVKDDERQRYLHLHRACFI